MLFIVLFAELSAHQTEVTNFYCHFTHIYYEEGNVPINGLSIDIFNTALSFC